GGARPKRRGSWARSRVGDKWGRLASIGRHRVRVEPATARARVPAVGPSLRDSSTRSLTVLGASLGTVAYLAVEGKLREIVEWLVGDARIELMAIAGWRPFKTGRRSRISCEKRRSRANRKVPVSLRFHSLSARKRAMVVTCSG